MTARENAARLLTLRVVRDWVAAEERALRETVTAEMVTGDRVTGLLDPADPRSALGYVLKAKGRESWTVTDPAALLDWCERVAPGEVVTTRKVRESFVSAVLADCKSQGGWVSPDGEVLTPDGVDVRQGEPTLTVKPAEGAAEMVREAIAARRLELGPPS